MKHIKQLQAICWDTTGMKMKPWTLGFGNGSVILGKVVETEPIKINNDNDTINI